MATANKRFSLYHNMHVMAQPEYRIKNLPNIKLQSQKSKGYTHRDDAK
jgi:hypothetical protein